MFRKPDEKKTNLKVGGRAYCDIDITGCKTLTSACISLQNCMNGIARWGKPHLNIFFHSGDKICGLLTAEDRLYLIYAEEGEQKITRIDGTAFGLSENADLEELLFSITKGAISDIRECADAWVDNILIPPGEYPSEKLKEKKKHFKRAMLGVVTALEESEIEAEKQYRFPEMLKEQIMLAEARGEGAPAPSVC